MRTAPQDRPLKRFELHLQDGEVLVSEWTLADLDRAKATGHDLAESLPDEPWMVNRQQKWNHPQDPVTFSADVETGHEDEARQIIEAIQPDPQSGSDGE